jgi:hypothetical protein
MFAHVAVLLTSGVLLTAVLLAGAWFVFGQSATVRDRLDMVKTVLIVVGGVGGVVALTVMYRKQRHSEVADERELYRSFTDRYVKAAEQLGHDKPSVRVAGVYAMAELGDDWAAGRQLCVDVLCAYVRLPAAAQDGEREVRRTLFRVIRDHLRPDAQWSRVKWSDCRFSFEGATIEAGDLSGCLLTGHGLMSFHGARFTHRFSMNAFTLQRGARLWFTEVTFDGERVGFDRADFRGSKVSFAGAEFARGEVTFRDLVYDDGLVTRADVTYTGGTVDWGTLPALPMSTTP